MKATIKGDLFDPLTLLLLILIFIVAIVAMNSCKEPVPLRSAILPCTCIDKAKRGPGTTWDCVDGKFYIRSWEYWEECKEGDIIDELLIK